ncbi:hypothetical protein WDW89_22735 [Deltaproteobacteria bacterium TL4]
MDSIIDSGYTLKAGQLFQLVPKLQLGNAPTEAPASVQGSRASVLLSSQAGAWELEFVPA